MHNMEQHEFVENFVKKYMDDFEEEIHDEFEG